MSKPKAVLLDGFYLKVLLEFCLASFSDRWWPKSKSHINAFSSKLLLVRASYHRDRKQTRTTVVIERCSRCLQNDYPAMTGAFTVISNHTLVPPPITFQASTERRLSWLCHSVSSLLYVIESIYFKDIWFLSLCFKLCVHAYVHKQLQCLKGWGEGRGSSRAGVQVAVSTRNFTGVFCKRSTCS